MTPSPALDLPPFRPRFPWYGPHLQTMANRIVPPSARLAPHAGERLALALPDGSGDTLLAMLDRPLRPVAGRRPVILVHGLTGCETSAYMLASARHLLGLGHAVLRLNLRGAGPSRRVCGGQYYAGRTEDFRMALRLLPDSLLGDGVLAVGFSLGGAMLLKYLGEEGGAGPVRAAATVCSPIDLSATCRHMLLARNRFYHGYIIELMRREATAEGARLSAEERAAILGSRDVWQYDDRFIAPRHGFAGAEDYYERNRPTRFMPAVAVPTLVVAAADDPWIPVATYRGFDWAGNPNLVPAICDGGGHVGFHGSGSAAAWHDRAIERFFARQ